MNEFGSNHSIRFARADGSAEYASVFSGLGGLAGRSLNFETALPKQQLGEMRRAARLPPFDARRRPFVATNLLAIEMQPACFIDARKSDEKQPTRDES
ncbi:MAG: hypothetical protein KGL43_18705 [Burkholderiales bacterium]|nr:hypothetical protein [Burkholderiales bacterium]MDE2393958.1 hypothetical protein [Burkholderiales bacterium]MDE2455623.1 hypothetical protein [Burkholderiales bacterium]